MAGTKISAQDFIDNVVDPGSFTSWDTTPVKVHADEKYQADLRRAAEKSGTDESVLTGTGTVHGRRVALIACEFSFLAGSIGVAAAERGV